MAKSPLTFFTICSANYFPLARTLFESLVAHEPGAQFTLFLADTLPHGADISTLPFSVVPAHSLMIPSFADMAFRYDIMEFNTAIKPFCFQHIFADDPSARAVYLDPDIFVTGRFDPIEHAFDQGAELILTPHTLAPLDDGYAPDDRALMQTGAYNLGFAAMRKTLETDVLLNWWADHMRTRCVSDLPGGLFVDQKFMDMAPAFVSRTEIIRHRGLNVAYWNLHERPVAFRDGQWTAGGDPLIFFHFSGVDRNDPEKFSKHQNRYTGSDIGAARQLLETYQQALHTHQDPSWEEHPYAYGAFTCGTPIHHMMRRVYRRVYPEPRDLSEGEVFIFAPDLYNAPSDDLLVPGSRPVSRIMHETWRQRSDLRAAFNLRREKDVDAFSLWFSEKARSEIGLPAQLIPGAKDSPNAPPQTPIATAAKRRARSIRMVGYFSAESGVGEGARVQHMCFEEAGLATSLRTVLPSGFANLADGRQDANDDSAILYLHINADQTPAVLDSLGPGERDGRYTIGYWAWELPIFPVAWSPALDRVDEVWVPSTFTAKALAQVTSKPITVVPHAIQAPSGDRARGRQLLGLSDDVVVVSTVFDTRSFLKRKNPAGALEAFRRARAAQTAIDCVLLIKSHGPLTDQTAQRFFAQAAEEPNVLVRHEVMDAEAMADLYAATDIFLSLHRSEGFGLGIANAMAHGAVVIATGWSGNTDFMTPTNSVLVPSTIRNLVPGDYPFAEGQSWAEPDIAAAEKALADLLRDPAPRHRIGQQAVADMREELSVKRVSQVAAARITTIHDTILS
ncbi:MAG: glycosyltransferase [Pseudomonadota bacterium]